MLVGVGDFYRLNCVKHFANTSDDIGAGSTVATPIFLQACTRNTRYEEHNGWRQEKNQRNQSIDMHHNNDSDNSSEYNRANGKTKVHKGCDLLNIIAKTT